MSQRQSTTPAASSEKALEAARDLLLVQGSSTYHRPCHSLHWAIVKPARWLSWQASRAAPSHSDFFSSFFISPSADGPHHYHPACGHKGSSHLSPIHALQFFIAMQVQHSYNSSTNS